MNMQEQQTKPTFIQPVRGGMPQQQFYMGPNATKNLKGKQTEDDGDNYYSNQQTPVMPVRPQDNATEVLGQHSKNQSQKSNQFTINHLSQIQKLLDYLHSGINNQLQLLARYESTRDEKIAKQLRFHFLVNCRCFCYINQTKHKDFNNFEHLVSRFKRVEVALNLLIEKVKSKEELSFVDFPSFSINSRSDLIKYLRVEEKNSSYSLKILNFIYQYILAVYTLGSNSQNSSFKLFEQIKLYIYGIKVPIWRNIEFYPLHHAIYQSQLMILRRIATQQITSPDDELNASDPFGLSPLNLAVMYNLKESLLLCSDLGGDPEFSHAHPNIPMPIDQAIMMTNAESLKTMIFSAHNHQVNTWNINAGQLIKSLDSISDFSCQMKWEYVSSFIPFMQKWTPSDTYRIYKMGSSVRIDMGLINHNNDWIKGNWSLLFKGKEYKNAGKLYLINLDQNLITQALDDLSTSQVQLTVDEVLKNKLLFSSNLTKAKNMILKPATTWRGGVIKESVNNINTQKFTLNAKLYCEEFKSDIFDAKNKLNAKKIPSYQEFFEQNLQKNAIINYDELEKSNSIIDFLEKYQEQSRNKPNENAKELEGELWFTTETQIQICHITPIIKILSILTNSFEIMEEILDFSQSMISNSAFPVQMAVPLQLNVSAKIQFNKINEIKCEKSLFEIDNLQKSQKSFHSRQSSDTNFDENIQTRHMRKSSRHVNGYLVTPQVNNGGSGAGARINTMFDFDDQNDDDFEYIDTENDEDQLQENFHGNTQFNDLMNPSSLGNSNQHGSGGVPGMGGSGGGGHNRQNSDYVNVFDQSRNSIANLEETITLDRNAPTQMSYDDKIKMEMQKVTAIAQESEKLQKDNINFGKKSCVDPNDNQRDMDPKYNQIDPKYNQIDPKTNQIPKTQSDQKEREDFKQVYSNQYNTNTGGGNSNLGVGGQTNFQTSNSNGSGGVGGGVIKLPAQLESQLLNTINQQKRQLNEESLKSVNKK